jgi:cysteine-rich repeat protein
MDSMDGPVPPCPECSAEVCGNGIQETGEECDDGNSVDGDACTTLCAGPRCGDGIASTNEECEDGNTADGDGCSADCETEECGDGHTTPNEQCDDGNLAAGDGCGPSCRAEICGDGIVQSWSEQCDDGNRVDSDLCRNECTHPASLNSLSSSCAFIDQITQTVCMVATANWCKQFGHDPIAGLVTGISADNEYTVGCIVGFEQKDVATSKLDQCPGGRQQSPSCLEQINTACTELGYGRGFYLGLGSNLNTYALACDYGTPSTASV